MSAWPLYRAMVGVGLGCGLLIVTVYQLTKPVIARNQAAALERAIFQVLPAATSSRTFETGDGPVHAGYDAERRLVGLALEASAMGYQDVIHLLYGYDFEAQTVIGIRVLESRETPGLGDKIESDADFLASLAALDVTLAPDGSGLAHPIEAVQGTPEHPWQVDGITGATISSVAVATALRESASARLPAVRARLDDFREAP